MQGCPLRCACCHNPDTWDLGGGKIVSAEEIFRKIQRLRAYFGKDGGVTVSGGEPLLQADFVAELFSLCRADGISCALDTSGCVYNESVERLLSLTDLVLLDYKYTNDTDYKKYTGMSMHTAEDFLARLDALSKRVWIRQVIIPTLNDSEESVRRLYALSERYSCIEKTELLPFRKLCVEKYRALGIDFPLENIPEASEELIERLKKH
jgi:pyruvate formate lyase activating enzyme